MSEWSSEWGSGGTREVTASVGEGGRSGAKVTGFQLGEGEGDRQRGGEGRRDGGREVYGERARSERADKRISPMTFHFDSCQFFS